MKQASQRNCEVELAIKKLHEHQSTNIEHQGKPQQLLIQRKFHVSKRDPWKNPKGVREEIVLIGSSGTYVLHVSIWVETTVQTFTVQLCLQELKV